MSRPWATWAAIGASLVTIGCGHSASTELDEGAAEPAPKAEAKTPAAATSRTPTFAADVAAIVYDRCLKCHRAGATGPFELSSYDDVASRAEQIADVVASRYMPPWKPSPGYVDLQHDAGLTDDQIALFAAWAAAGAPEGDPASTPRPPTFVEGWRLGEPDLVAAMPRPYEMYAEGPDVYRSFAVAVDLDQPRWVSAIEFDPGGERTAHHAFFTVDRTGRALKLDGADGHVGFAGMSELSADAQKPVDQFLSWQVGRNPDGPQDGVAWRLHPGDVLVFEMHLIATGKPESVQAQVGLHFTDEPPRKHPVIVSLVGQEIDIAPGEADYVVSHDYTLSQPAIAVGVLPHAHYVGKRLHAWATLPDGRRQWLIRIDDWDLNWQSAYYFQYPLPLPTGTVITQHFEYDNSAANPRNPFSPPRRIQYGREATDEMAELHVQFVCDSPEEALALRRDADRWRLRLRKERFERAVARDANDAEAHLELGKIAFALGQDDAASKLLQRALELNLDLAEGHYYLGYVLLRRKQYTLARVRFTYAVSLDPTDYRSQAGIAKTFLEEGDPSAAGREFVKALNLNDDDPYAHLGYAQTLFKLKRYADAARHFRDAHRLDPSMTSALQNAEAIERQLQRQTTR